MIPAMSSNYLPRHSQNAAMCQQHSLEKGKRIQSLPEDCPMFNVAYNETTINSNYTNLETLIALKVDAKSKVETFLIYLDSVSHVMNVLEFHYELPQILIRGRKMYDIVNVSKMVFNLTAFLENTGATPHLSNITLLDELIPVYQF